MVLKSQTFLLDKSTKLNCESSALGIASCALIVTWIPTPINAKFAGTIV
jgi:hypothetical protein